MIKYYELLNRFYREGLISAEAQTYSMEKYTEVKNSGLSFMQLRSAGEAMQANTDAAAAGIDYRWKLLTHELSDDAVFIKTGIGWSGTFITKKCKDPDRAIRFFAWARTDEGRHLGSWGIQGVHWDYDAQGRTVGTESYHKAIAEGKTRASFWYQLMDFRRQGRRERFRGLYDDRSGCDRYDGTPEMRCKALQSALRLVFLRA